MADREDNVYKAKLAEQAERYEGNGALAAVLVLWAWLEVGKKNVCEFFFFLILKILYIFFLQVKK